MFLPSGIDEFLLYNQLVLDFVFSTIFTFKFKYFTLKFYMYYIIFKGRVQMATNFESV